jgi:hypothetical protein
VVPQAWPAIIDKQLEQIARLDEEFRPDTSPRAESIRERLNKARAYYAGLRSEMLASK